MKKNDLWRSRRRLFGTTTHGDGHLDIYMTNDNYDDYTWLVVVAMNVVYGACVLVAYTIPTSAPPLRVHVGLHGIPRQPRHPAVLISQRQPEERDQVPMRQPSCHRDIVRAPGTCDARHAAVRIIEEGHVARAEHLDLERGALGELEVLLEVLVL